MRATALTESTCCSTLIQKKPKLAGDLFWGETKAGDSILMEAQIHHWRCKKRPKREPKAPDPLIEALEGNGYKTPEARRLAAKAGSGTLEERLLRVLSLRAEELNAAG